MSFEKKIRTRWNDPSTGGFKIMEMTAREIVANPTRHEFEPIVSAICACVDTLIKREEEREERLRTILNSAAPLREVNIEHNEGVN